MEYVLGKRSPSDHETRHDLRGAALASLAAAAVALVLRVVDPFAHGNWLIAYLVLVGFLAQLLLGLGQAALLSACDATPPTKRVRRAQALLWNVGVVAVPLGVLAETRLAVVVGSISMIAALISLTRTARPALATAFARRLWSGWGYASLLAAMGACTLIGTALAWDIPWT
jgi:hypothetical protein